MWRLARSVPSGSWSGIPRAYSTKATITDYASLLSAWKSLESTDISAARTATPLNQQPEAALRRQLVNTICGEDQAPQGLALPAAPADAPAGWAAGDRVPIGAEWAAELDPIQGGRALFDVDACRLETTMTTNPNPRGADYDAKVVLHVPDSATLCSAVELKYMRQIAGAKYDWNARSLRIITRRYPDAARNSRLAYEQAQAVLVEARKLAAEFGDFVQAAPSAGPAKRGKKRHGMRGRSL